MEGIHRGPVAAYIRTGRPARPPPHGTQKGEGARKSERAHALVSGPDALRQGGPVHPNRPIPKVSAPMDLKHRFSPGERVAYDCLQKRLRKVRERTRHGPKGWSSAAATKRSRHSSILRVAERRGIGPHDLRKLDVSTDYLRRYRGQGPFRARRRGLRHMGLATSSGPSTTTILSTRSLLAGGMGWKEGPTSTYLTARRRL